MGKTRRYTRGLSSGGPSGQGVVRPPHTSHGSAPGKSVPSGAFHGTAPVKVSPKASNHGSAPYNKTRGVMYDGSGGGGE